MTAPGTAPRLMEIFSEAVELTSTAQRAAYLDRACGGDRALQCRVEGLLGAHAQADRFLESPAPAPTADANPDGLPAPECLGTTIGPYKLLEQIGEGGMGVVYVAEQAQPMRRKVALKIIKPGMDTKQVVARFEAERQALAMMDHPNIARVHDGGATESGRPYFVMELVRGIPITEYCDREQLSVTERLELFVLVCRAVQHAHQKGIIHRDLKPSNILVTVIDGAAVPKIIDFGVAKATGAALTDRTLYTAFNQFVGTPLYMSPEQVELAGVDVDTRSDIYSLGVLLYELLTGTTPFDSETLKKAAFDEMRRIIREQEPQKPSLRLSSLGETLTTVSACRGADPRRLNRTVRGELDWIAMKALEKDRRRRYETANDLAADVMRHLTSRPVEACPPSMSYRLKKYARRNRVVLTTVVLVALALVVGTGVSLWQAGVARKAQRRATAEANAARRAQLQAEAAEARAATEAAIARAVNNFLQQDLLGQVDSLPKVSEGLGETPNLTVKEALDRAAAKIGDRFRDQPLVEAAIRTAIGEAYCSLSQHHHQFALPHLERAVALRRAHLGTDHPDTYVSMHRLAAAYPLTGRSRDAIALNQQMLENRMALLGQDHAETLECMSSLASAYLSAGQWDTSVPLLEQVLQKKRAVCGPTHPSTLGTMQELARNYAFAGRYAESIALHEELLESLKSKNESIIWCLETYAVCCQLAGKCEKAVDLLREAIVQNAKLEDSLTRRQGTANFRGWLALNLLLQAKYDDAEPFARQAVATFEKDRPDDPRRFFWVSILGAVLLGQQKYVEAEPLLVQGYEGMKQREAMLFAYEPRRMAQAGEWVVRFYEVTQQPEKAHTWREILSASPPPD